MLSVLARIAAGVFLVVWGGLCAALIGLFIVNSLLDCFASLWPHRFPKTAFARRKRDMEKVRQRIRKLQKLDFIKSTPECYGEACKNAIEEILTGGPDFFAKNPDLSGPRRYRRKRYTRNRKDKK
jgi:hypothetical protein